MELITLDRDAAKLNGAPDSIAGTTDGTVDARYFISQDSLGSAVALSDDPDPAVENGSSGIVERYSYSSYGEVTAWSGSWSGSSYSNPYAKSMHGLPLLYTGQRYDPEVDLYYYKNRQYDAKSGRFMSRDRIGYGDGPSLYQYAQSNAAVNVDRLGLASGPEMHTPQAIADRAMQDYFSGGNRQNSYGPSSHRNTLVSCAGIGAQDRDCGARVDRIRAQALTRHPGEGADIAGWRPYPVFPEDSVDSKDAAILSEANSRAVNCGEWFSFDCTWSEWSQQAQPPQVASSGELSDFIRATASDGSESWDKTKPFPDGPEDLGPDWVRDETHKAPNDELYVNPDTGDKVEWHKGQPDEPRWEGRDHWHWYPGGKKEKYHYPPGEKINNRNFFERLLGELSKYVIIS